MLSHDLNQVVSTAMHIAILKTSNAQTSLGTIDSRVVVPASEMPVSDVLLTILHRTMLTFSNRATFSKFMRERLFFDESSRDTWYHKRARLTFGSPDDHNSREIHLPKLHKRKVALRVRLSAPRTFAIDCANDDTWDSRSVHFLRLIPRDTSFQ